jgi:hypothetical protein
MNIIVKREFLFIFDLIALFPKAGLRLFIAV